MIFLQFSIGKQPKFVCVNVTMESDTYRFISLIEKHPQLYNKKHKDFLRQDIRNTIWDSICKEMNWDGKFFFSRGDYALIFRRHFSCVEHFFSVA